MDLGSLNIENIESILGSMSNEDMQQLKKTASALLSSSGLQGEYQEENGHKKESKQNNPFEAFDIDFETITRIMSFMEKLKNQPEDPRCVFLRSLKPMLSPEKRRRVDEAVKMMSIMSFLPIIQELGGK